MGGASGTLIMADLTELVIDVGEGEVGWGMEAVLLTGAHTCTQTHTYMHTFAHS